MLQCQWQCGHKTNLLACRLFDFSEGHCKKLLEIKF
jgi:hypothetical protein